MFYEENIENQLELQEKRMKELACEIDSLDREIEELMAPLGLTKEQVEVFLRNQDHFTKDEWETLENLKNELSLKMETRLSQKQDVSHTKKVYKELNSARNWLFVR